MLRIDSIRISNTFGCEDFYVGPFSVVRITGPNAAGKSSVLKGLASVFGGGVDPSIIRRWKCADPAHTATEADVITCGVEFGSWIPMANCEACGGKGYIEADESVVAFTLNDGTSVSKTTRMKRGRRGGEPTGYTTDLIVTQPDGTPRKAPKAYIDELGELTAIDPSSMLKIDTSKLTGKNQLAAELLRMVPIKFTAAEINSAAKYLEPKDVYTLDDLKKIVAGITEERRRLGAQRDEAAGTVSGLQKSLPESSLPAHQQHMASNDASAEEKAAKVALEDAEDDRRTIEHDLATRTSEVEAARQQAYSLVDTAWATAKAEIDQDIDARIKALEQERVSRKLTASTERDQKRNFTNEECARALEGIETELRPKLNDAIAEVARLKAAVDAQAKAVSTRVLIFNFEGKARTASQGYDALSKELQRLESLRLKRLKELPVYGLVVEDGIPYLDGIEWHHVNLARRVEAIVTICTHVSGKLPLIMIDDSEHLDAETWRLLEESLVAAGYQVICAAVSDAPVLKVEVKLLQAA